MNCPECGARTFVVDSRPRPGGERYRRYRCTSSPSHYFSTREKATPPRVPRPKPAPARLRNSVFDV